MQINSIKTTGQNFNGNISRKAAGFLLNNTQHFLVQGTSFFLAHKLVQPIDSMEVFLRTKIFIDLGEYLSLVTKSQKCTGKNQCTNIIPDIIYCAKDVIRWTGKLIDKIKGN